MSPEAEEVCVRAIEGGALDAEIWAYGCAVTLSAEERRVLKRLDERLEEICGEPSRQAAFRASLRRDSGYFYAAPIGKAIANRLDEIEGSP